MDILGIGNALIDIFRFSDDESALSLGLHPNHSAHVSAERMDELLLAIPEPIRVAGGSASNALKLASALGADTAFIGCVGTLDRESDADATSFKAELASFGVDCRTENRTGATGRCLVIHMPGGLKSIACAPSAASRLSPEQITDELVASAKLVLVDAPVLRNDALLARVASLCRSHDVPLALDGGSAELIRQHRNAISSLLETNKTILLLNTGEAEAFAEGLADDRSTDGSFARLTSDECEYPCIVEKRGERGAKAWSAGICAEDEGIPATAVLDDTGAGDAFNGAFLSAWLRKIPLSKALAFANETARGALDVPGTNFDRDRLRDLKATLNELSR